MTDELKPISPLSLGVMRKRARLQAVRKLQEAYKVASIKYGLTRKQFAERIGMKPSEFSRILNGHQNITIETAEAILRSLNHRIAVGIENIDELEMANTNRIVRSTSSETANMRVFFEQQPDKAGSSVTAKIQLDLDTP